MAITSLGVGSGLDLESLLTNLMQVEQRPLQQLAAKQSSYQTKLSGYSMVQSAISTFKSSVSSLSSISQYQKTSAGSTNTDVATITSSGTAANSSYTLKVSQLAQAQRLVTAEGVKDSKTAIGGGKITIDFGRVVTGSSTSTSTTIDEETGEETETTTTTETKTFESNNAGVKTIDIAEGSSLADIRDAINAANIGITASIVNDGSDTPYRLTLSSQSTGEKQSMKITVTDSEGEVDSESGLSKLLAYDPENVAGSGMTQTAAAQNAEFTLDGIKMTKASNSVSDAVEGVTIRLLSASEDKTTTLSVTRDTSGAKTAVESMVKAYNDLNTTLKDLTKYNAEEKTASVLTGDSAVRSVQSAMKSMLSTVISGGVQGYRTLSDVGVTVDKEGVLQIDSSKLGEAIEKNYDAFTAMFAEGGMSTNSAITFEDAEDYARTGSFDVEITQAATKGTYAFSLLKGTDAKAGLTGLDWSNVEARDRTMQVEINGVSKSITMDAIKYGSSTELAAALQSRINTAFRDTSASVSVEVDDDGKFTVTSSDYGSNSKVRISETGNLFGEKVQTDGLDVAGTINGEAATGSGQTLKGASGTAAYGIKLKITGEEPKSSGDPSIKGTVSFTQGFAYQFSKLADTLQGEGSAIQSRIDGVNKSMAQAEKDYATYEGRIATVEAQYRAKFTSLDLLVAQLNSTSDYLTTQLASLSSLWNQSRK